MLKYYFVTYRDHRPNAIVQSGSDDMKFGTSAGYSSFYGGYDTEKELREKGKLAEWPCSCCGGVVRLSYSNNKDLIQTKTCFTCNHWLEKAKYPNRGLVIDGNYYTHRGLQKTEARHRGFGGVFWKIKMKKSGEVVETNDLWHGGDIPERFRDVLADNAEFIK